MELKVPWYLGQRLLLPSFLPLSMFLHSFLFLFCLFLLLLSPIFPCLFVFLMPGLHERSPGQLSYAHVSPEKEGSQLEKAVSCFFSCFDAFLLPVYFTCGLRPPSRSFLSFLAFPFLSFPNTSLLCPSLAESISFHLYPEYYRIYPTTFRPAFLHCLLEPSTGWLRSSYLATRRALYSYRVPVIQKILRLGLLARLGDCFVTSLERVFWAAFAW